MPCNIRKNYFELKKQSHVKNTNSFAEMKDKFIGKKGTAEDTSMNMNSGWTRFGTHD